MRDPFVLLRQMTSELDRAFDDWQLFRGPALPARTTEVVAWSPKIDVIERDNRMVTRVDLPGMTKKDVTVEVKEGYLTLSGERKREFEETKGNWYRTEREYGRFYRAVPLPEGVKPGDVKAAFTDGVLEVSFPMPARLEAKPAKIEIEEAVKPVKTVAA
jgi:HSP20 family protein